MIFLKTGTFFFMVLFSIKIVFYLKCFDTPIHLSCNILINVFQISNNGISRTESLSIFIAHVIELNTSNSPLLPLQLFHTCKSVPI